MKETVKSMLSGTLTEFAQSKSDAVSVEAGEFERLEGGYREFMSEEKGEQFIVDLMEKMCVESLNPALYNYWLIIKHRLAVNRIGLLDDLQTKSEADAATSALAGETLRILKLLTSDSDAETPDFQDALNCCHLN